MNWHILSIVYNWTEPGLIILISNLRVKTPNHLQNPKQMAAPEKMTKKKERKWGKINKFMTINISSATVHCLQLQVQLGLKVFYSRLLLCHLS